MDSPSEMHALFLTSFITHGTNQRKIDERNEYFKEKNCKLEGPHEPYVQLSFSGPPLKIVPKIDHPSNTLYSILLTPDKAEELARCLEKSANLARS